MYLKSLQWGFKKYLNVIKASSVHTVELHNPLWLAGWLTLGPGLECPEFEGKKFVCFAANTKQPDGKESQRPQWVEPYWSLPRERTPC